MNTYKIGDIVRVIGDRNAQIPRHGPYCGLTGQHGKVVSIKIGGEWVLNDRVEVLFQNSSYIITRLFHPHDLNWGSPAKFLKGL